MAKQKEFFVDFSGYVRIAANNEEEASEKLYELFAEGNFPSYAVDVDGVEKVEK